MRQQQLVSLALILAGICLTGCISQTQVKASNESSYKWGYSFGNETTDLGNNCEKSSTSLKDLTNVTSCIDGYYNGWKSYCIRDAKDCVQNFILGDFPKMAIKAHHEYIRGNTTANGSGTAMCPIGENAAFCSGFNSNNDDYGSGDCSDTPLANISQRLVGCPEDIFTNSQIAGIPELVGKWNFMNQTETEVSKNIPGITGTMLFNNNGYYLLAVPSKTALGDYTLEASWGTQGHNLLTICYSAGCENNTLSTVSPNYIRFNDNNHNTIQLTKIQLIPTLQTIPKEHITIVPHLNGTWNMTSNGAINKTLGQITFGSNNEFTGTFDANREPVKGIYSYKMGDFGLSYTYHNHPVQIDSKLNVTDHDDMKIWNISVYNSTTIGSNHKITTGLYLRPGYIISLARSPPIHFVNSLIGHWTFYNQTSPAVTAALSHGFTAKQKNVTDIFNPLDLDHVNIQAAIKTNSDREKWTDYIMSLAKMKTGDIRFESSMFEVTPSYNNGLCIADEYTLGCAPGEWSTDGQTLKLTYDAGSFSKDQGPAGLPLSLPPRAFSVGTILTFKSVTPERMIATDSHNDIIYFLRDHLAKTLLPVNLVGTWRFSINVMNGTGPTTSGKFMFERGTHEVPTSIGAFSVSNANFTEIPFYEKFANGSVYTFTLNDIKRGNWDMDNHILSLYYFGLGIEVWLLKVMNPNTIELSGNSGYVIHMNRIGV